MGRKGSAQDWAALHVPWCLALTALAAVCTSQQAEVQLLTLLLPLIHATTGRHHQSQQQPPPHAAAVHAAPIGPPRDDDDTLSVATSVGEGPAGGGGDLVGGLDAELVAAAAAVGALEGIDGLEGLDGQAAKALKQLTSSAASRERRRERNKVLARKTRVKKKAELDTLRSQVKQAPRAGCICCTIRSFSHGCVLFLHPGGHVG